VVVGEAPVRYPGYAISLTTLGTYHQHMLGECMLDALPTSKISNTLHGTSVSLRKEISSSTNTLQQEN
jgi:hypothetical protein